MRWLRSPPVHFMLIGAALFVMRRPAVAPGPRRAPTVAQDAPLMTPGRIEEISADFARQRGAPPTADEAQWLLTQAIDEEVLYREGLAWGLDRDDKSVRWRLVEKMRFLTDAEDAQAEEPEGHGNALYREALGLHLDQDDVIVRRIVVQKMRLLAEREGDAEPPGEAELQAYLDAHADRYREPARLTLWHVFFSADQHGAAVERQAQAVLARLRMGDATPADAARLGDPFPGGAQLRAQSERDLAKALGEDFATTVATLAPGAWMGPLRSAYGLHLVRVEVRDPERVSTLATVHPRVQAELLEDRRREQLAAALAHLRAKYGVPPVPMPAAGDSG